MKFHAKSEKEDVKTSIMTLVKEQNGIVITSEVASKLKISWNTAEKYLLELTLEGKLGRLKKLGTNIWHLKMIGENNGNN